MNKLFTKIAALALGMTMATGVGVAVASGSKEASPADATTVTGEFTKYTESSITEGDYVFYVSYTASKVSYTQTMKNTVSSSKIQSQSLTLSSGKVVNPDDSIVWHIAASGDYWTIQNVNNSKYVVATGAASQANLGSTAGSQGLFSFSYSSNWTITSKYNTDAGKNAKFCANRAATNYWACYAAGSPGVDLYKKASIPVTGVTVSPLGCGLLVGGTQQLTPTVSPSNATNKNVSYSSNATGVATVSSGGLITAVAPGNATITVTTADGGFTATCTVTVTSAVVPVTGVSLNKGTTTIEAPNTETLTATVAPADATNKNVTWSTSAPGVATVSEGVVTAVSAGTATITVTTNDGGFTATCTVTVTAPSTVTFLAGTDVGTATAAGQEGTITKSGISFYCSSTRNYDAPYRLYKDATVTFTSTVGNMAKIEFSGSSSDKISNMDSATTGTLVTDSTNNKATWTGNASTVSFTMTAQGRADTIVVTLASSDPLVELDASSATSISMMKGDSDTSVKVHVVNIASKTWTFTFDEDEEEGIGTSSYINVSAGAAVSDVHTLTITTKAVGSTTMHISVSGTACATTIPVTVAAKPASMIVTESDHETQITTLELQSGGATKQVYWIGEDTDGNAYSITASQVNGEIVSGSSYVTISSGAGTQITPVAAGTAVIRYSLKVLSSVYAEITVNVVDDYKTTVNSITFNSNLIDTQGDAVDTSAVFATKVANTHFGSTETISDSELLFCYENNRSSAEGILVFSYDFSHGTTVDPTHKSQTIYIFTTFDSSYSGSYTITIEQKNDPLTAITFTNVVDNKVDVTRGSTFQLEWAYTPTNPTDGKEVVFRVDDNDDGIGITVSADGLISISASSDLGTALVVIESAHDDTIQDYVYVTATLETMKYIVNEEESLTPSTTVAVGDRVVMVAVDKNSAKYEFTAFSGASTDYGVATSYTTSVSKSLILTVVAGNSSGTVAFKTSDDYYVAWVSGKNSITPKATLDNYGSWTIDGSTFQNKQDTTRFMYLNYNSGTPRFACYADKSSDTTGNYTVPTFLKITGGDTEYTVDETLFNGVHDNFGEDKTYEWSETCSSFNTSNWASAGSALTGISGFANYKLNRAVANASGNEIEQFLAKYDFIIGKFGTAYDFLGRFQSGGINYGAARVTPNSILGDNVNTVAIIVVISAISASAIGGYFFLRKRKEN